MGIREGPRLESPLFGHSCFVTSHGHENVHPLPFATGASLWEALPKSTNDCQPPTYVTALPTFPPKIRKGKRIDVGRAAVPLSALDTQSSAPTLDLGPRPRPRPLLPALPSAKPRPNSQTLVRSQLPSFHPHRFPQKNRKGKRARDDLAVGLLTLNRPVGKRTVRPVYNRD
jgi:hypothetical protein